MIRVLICDDHQIVRQGIKQMLADTGDLQVAGEAASGPELIGQLRALQAADALAPPPVVLLDIALPQRDGLDILKALKAEFAKLPVLMLSTYPDRQYAVRSLKLGASGYLNKSADAEQLSAAVRKVATGGLFITPAIAEQLAQVLGGGIGAPTGADRPAHELLSHPRASGLPAAGAGPQRGRDRRAAGAVAQHGQHLPCAHPRKDRHAQ